ncbi:MAG: hypothetical protein DYG89_18015 [Caldilinea sp. CFX5]|nr:hypothetical protein [Caldilinea sp. CFX5]
MVEQSATPPPQAHAGQTTAEITPALVQAIADKVYALWLADLKIERERLRLTGRRQSGQGGRR